MKYTLAHPDLYHFDERGVLFSEKDDIVITRRQISQTYLLFLKSIGCSIAEHYISSDEVESGGPYSIFHDFVLHEKIGDLINAQTSDNPWQLECFMLTEYEKLLAQKLNLDDQRYSDYHSFCTKSLFRGIGKKHNFPIPYGYSVHPLLKIPIYLLLFLRGLHEIVIKDDEGMAGAGSYRLNLWRLPQSFRGKKKNVFQNMVSPQLNKRIVIERWIPDVLYSPSVQLKINPDGSIKVLSTHIQLMGKNKLMYVGCLSSHWLDVAIKERLIHESTNFASAYHAYGYVGHLTFNAVVTKHNKIIWVEANPRRVMSSYPHTLCKKIYGAKFGNVCYAAKVIQKDKWRGFTVEKMMDSLECALLDQDKQGGVVPIDFSLLHSQGSLHVAAFGRSKVDVLNLIQHVEAQ